MYLLAFDHRDAFLALFEDDRAAAADGKALVYDAVREAVRRGVAPANRAGILVDEQLGADVARRAKADGTVLAMPVERSAQAVFTFDYGDAWREHVEAFDPDVCKVLVRYHPDGDAAANAVQRERLKELADWLRPTRRRFLFELIVPGATAEERPELIRRTMAEIQAADIHVDIWKLEGVDRAEDAAALVRQARCGGRDDVVCTVLGAGADAATVRRWLAVAGATEGYTGFAIGRSIWQEPLRRHRDREIGRDEAIDAIVAGYAAFVDAFDAARAATTTG